MKCGLNYPMVSRELKSCEYAYLYSLLKRVKELQSEFPNHMIVNGDTIWACLMGLLGYVGMYLLGIFAGIFFVI